MKSILVNDLPRLTLDRMGLVLYDNFQTLLHFDQKRCSEVFKSLIIQTLLEYERVYPLQHRYQSNETGTVFKFVDNFQSYLDGKITEFEITLVPTRIYFVKNTGLNGSFVNAQWWKYNKDRATLYTRATTLSRPYFSYFSHYPYHIEIAPDFNFTEDSRIYFLEIDTNQNFLDYLAFYTITQIRRIQSSINLNTPVQFLSNLDTTYSELEQIIQTHRDNRTDILEMWRK